MTVKPNPHTSSHPAVGKQRILDALHVINKQAKQRHNQLQQKLTTVPDKKLRQRKRALYETKYAALKLVQSAATYAERHIINGTDYYCVFFDEYSFHIPVDELTPDIAVTAEKYLTSWTPSAAVRNAMAVETALSIVEDTLGINANDYLNTTAVECELKGELVDVRWQTLCE